MLNQTWPGHVHHQTTDLAVSVIAWGVDVVMFPGTIRGNGLAMVQLWLDCLVFI
jgi:hypothetical protein